MTDRSHIPLLAMVGIAIVVVAACTVGGTPEPATPLTGAVTAAPATNAECPCPCPTAAPIAQQPAGSASQPDWPGVPVATVRLVGEPFFVRATEETDIRRCAGLVAGASTVADGTFLSPSQCWDEGAVWWEDAMAWTGELSAAEDRWIELELDGTFVLHQAVVQADNNDAYLMSYRDLATGAWLPLWTVPPAYSFGMATRPDPMNNAARQPLPLVVSTDAVRLEAEFGDGMYSVSEIQLFGEPATG